MSILSLLFLCLLLGFLRKKNTKFITFTHLCCFQKKLIIKRFLNHCQNIRVWINNMQLSLCNIFGTSRFYCWEFIRYLLSVQLITILGSQYFHIHRSYENCKNLSEPSFLAKLLLISLTLAPREVLVWES